MIKCFNRRISSDVLVINIKFYRTVEQVLRSFNTAYNTQRPRVLNGETPNSAGAKRINVEPKFANPAPNDFASFCDTTKARLVVDAAKEVSLSNNQKRA